MYIQCQNRDVTSPKTRKNHKSLVKVAEKFSLSKKKMDKNCFAGEKRKNGEVKISLSRLHSRKSKREGKGEGGGGGGGGGGALEGGRGGAWRGE